MNPRFKKAFLIIVVVQLLAFMTLANFHNVTTAQLEAPAIRILDASTGLGVVELGNATTTLPPEGYSFTVNVTLDGSISDLITYQIGIKFDSTKVRCTAAWITKTDPNFVFFGKTSILSPVEIGRIDNVTGYFATGATLLTSGIAVSRGLFCQANFTAIKTGTSSLDLTPPTDIATDPYYGKDTFLWDSNQLYVSYIANSLSVSISASPTPPIADFTFSPSNPEANQTITFDASISFDPDGNIVSYYWDFGDSSNETTTAATVAHMYSLKGMYFVSLTVTDNEGYNGSIVQSVPIGGIPYANFTYDPPEPYMDDDVTFNATSSYDRDGYIALYSWNFSLLKFHAEDTTFEYLTVDVRNETTTNATLTLNFTQNGIYNVKLTVFDNDTLSNSREQYIFVGIRPIANFTFPQREFMPDEVIVFDAYGSDVPTEGYSWDPDGFITYAIWNFGDLTITAFNVTESRRELVTSHTYVTQGGVYTVNLTVFDNDGLYTFFSRDVNVTILYGEQQAGTGWEGYATAGAIFGIIIAVAVWYRRRPEREPSTRERYRVI